MQTIQEQTPQSTLPVVRPHLVPPATGPNVKEGYKSYSVRRLAITQIILGCFAFGFQIWDLVNISWFSVLGTGIWCGVFFILTGCIGMYSANSKTVCSIVSYMVMSIFSSFMAISLLVISSINLSFYSACRDDYFCHQRTITILLSTTLLIISVAEGFMAILAASLACHGCCCSTNEKVLPYTYPVQYVQGPNGQLVLVTGQQPNMITTVSGQQVLVASNQGGYQPLGPPFQGNNQTPGNPAQSYLATVPTMPTQQSKPQPDSVQPPAYQAVEEQQPEVHQSTEKEKTNLAYFEV